MDIKKAQRGAGLAAVFQSQPAPGSVGQQTGEISEHAVMLASRADGTIKEKPKPVKATYYIDPALVRGLKFLAVERNKDQSAMVNESIRDLLAKYHSQ